MLSARPTAPVLVQLSPPSGRLSGSLSTTAAAGNFSFLNLAINSYGLDYLLRYSSTPSGARRLLTMTSTLFVSFAAEFSVRPAEGRNGDRVCSSLAISGTVAICGAPFSNLSTTPIQVVSTVSESGVAPTMEIQLLQTMVVPRATVQRFQTSAQASETVGGSFRLYWGSHGPTDPVPANADENMLKAFLEAAIEVMGSVSVRREPNLFCACDGAYTWTVTMEEQDRGETVLLRTDGSGLTGRGAAVSSPSVLQHPALLGGYFAVQLVRNSTTDASSSLQVTQSDFVAYDANAKDIESAFQQLGLSVFEVSVTPPDSARTRKVWIFCRS